MDPVLKIDVPGVMELTVLGNISSKQASYRDRLVNDPLRRHKKDDAEVAVGPLYYLSEPGKMEVWREQDEDHGFPCEFNTRAECENGLRAPPVFFETRYVFRAKCHKSVKKVAVYHRLASVVDGFTFADGWLFGDIDFINTPGRFTLALDVTFQDGSSRRIQFKFTVVSVKMDVEGDYKEILDKIEGERKGLVQNFLSKTFGDSGFDPKGTTNKPVWYAILESVFDFYTGACKKIINDPHRRYERVAESRRADQVKRWSPALANRYHALSKDRRESVWFRVDRIEANTDTQENRFVLHTLKDIAKQLRAFGVAYKSVDGISQECLADVENQAKELDRLAANPFFKGVGRYTGGGTQSLVLQKRPGYAQILTTWIKLKQALSPKGKGFDIGYRPLSALYEFWTFLAVRDLLRGDGWTTGPIGMDGLLEGFEVQEDPQISDPDGLLDSDDEARAKGGVKTLCRMGYKFTKGTRTVCLAYQQTYGTGDQESTFANVYDQRPDIVLSIRDGVGDDAEVYTYLFDAKYRIDEFGGKDASPRDAIDDMHRYRDAILYRRQKAGFSHEIIGAYVLFPGRSNDLTYDYTDMRAKENIGAFPLLPGSRGLLKSFLREILLKQTKKAHLSNAIPPRGAEISLVPVVTDDMIYVVENLAFEQAKSYIDHSCYVCLRSEISKPVETYRQIRFSHTGNADMYVNITSFECKPKKYLSDLPGLSRYSDDDELVVFRLTSAESR